MGWVGKESNFMVENPGKHYFNINSHKSSLILCTLNINQGLGTLYQTNSNRGNSTTHLIRTLENGQEHQKQGKSKKPLRSTGSQ